MKNATVKLEFEIPNPHYSLLLSVIALGLKEQGVVTESDEPPAKTEVTLEKKGLQDNGLYLAFAHVILLSQSEVEQIDKMYK